MTILDGPELADAHPVSREAISREAISREAISREWPGSGHRTGAHTGAHAAPATSAGPSAPANDEWISLLSSPGPGHAEALAGLHQLLLRAARHQVSVMSAQTAGIGEVRRQELIGQAADEAMVAVLGKLASFEGRSRFTTWAYKFGILHAAVEVRRSLWRNREVALELLPEPAAVGHSPEQLAEAADFSEAVSNAIAVELTAHQRQVVMALVVDEVPIDVLADRLGTNRNALYKTLHDARGRLRRHLQDTGYLDETAKGVIP
ncbi:RNA polymerase sigma-70 factor (ECF subfamily) [Arthrobacter silviterrae]|uniref:Sigma-70 family RNA polymerase sigma factor n=1 Tax=Arthrobacter silviterrae TaxID=2026658 RepID=A0ABX0DC67_9MICC|nr:sigma-70 family RNA polymerase sigma factor [Arthrobacter silviterrae]MDQ0279387.1 RNA polymerase sigma-70 factor (ECF subfamily) [Arthrobacter silviterrae]NGN83415.1 sigma-70 family RNA polymerase sigma factor [Arthrobacter silviterrae]